ncbi:MarR family winged helix-turn-helix transcriptional regulator [Paenibacillus sp. GCM10023252]|uniref:MarR family winged helix-turn-helix transcriptional regulator n=1 Tax=Paenibacillus sp. GCM10023252 TaxID=3252649 RepID=UPI00361375B2
MDREELLRLEHQLCFSLYATAREVTRLYRPYLDKLGITYTQYVTLLVLWEQDDVPVKVLGEKLYLDSGTLTPLLKKLEGMGYVRRLRDAKDERSVRVQLTEQGRELREQVLDLPEMLFCKLGMSAEQTVALRTQLQELTRYVHESQE